MSNFAFDWTLKIADHAANLDKWWKGIEFPTRLPETDSTVAAWLADWAGRYDIAHNFVDYVAADLTEENRYHGAVSYSDLAKAIRAFDPRVSRVNGADQIIIYESALKRQAGKRLALNPGKAIRRIIPNIPDRYLEKAVDEFKVKFDSAAYEIKWGETRADFRFAYEGHNYAPTQNVRFSDWRKSLANSCMRHNFSHDGCGNIHPAEVYASGDFRILMALHKETGKVAARCVVRIDESKIPRPEYLHAPIYTANDNAADLLESALSEVFAERAGYPNRDFQGARLLFLKCPGGIVAPYQDIGPARIDRPDSDDKYLTLTDSGDLSYGSTSGYIRFKSETCCECGCDWDEDSDYTDENGNRYCESCYSEEFGYCEECEDSARHDDLETCYRWNHDRGRAREICVCDSCRRRNYTETINGEYWHDSDVLETHDGDSISIRDYEDSYFTSDYSGDIFPQDEYAETESGDSYAISECEELGWIKSDSGIWAEPDPEEQAQQAMAQRAMAECAESVESLNAGQLPLIVGLPRHTILEFEDMAGIDVPAMGGMTQWQIAESVALATFPEIGTLNKATGETWYYFTDHSLPYHDSQIREFATLAECLTAIQTMKGL